jgi:hypothetical protein
VKTKEECMTKAKPFNISMEVVREAFRRIRSRGWIQYYGAFWRSALDRIFHLINMHIVSWFKAKYRVRLNGRAWEWLMNVINRQPDLFEHWKQRNVAAGQ